MTYSDIVGTMCGFLVIVFGVFLLHAFKDVKVTFKDLLLLTSQSNDSPPQSREEPLELVVEPGRHASTNSTGGNSPPIWNRAESTRSRSDSEEEILVTDRYESKHLIS